jgi:hypothetical protein
MRNLSHFICKTNNLTVEINQNIIVMSYHGSKTYTNNKISISYQDSFHAIFKLRSISIHIYRYACVITLYDHANNNELTISIHSYIPPYSYISTAEHKIFPLELVKSYFHAFLINNKEILESYKVLNKDKCLGCIIL